MELVINYTDTNPQLEKFIISNDFWQSKRELHIGYNNSVHGYLFELQYYPEAANKAN